MQAVISDRVKQVHPDKVQGKDLRIVPISGVSTIEPNYRLLDKETLPSVRVTEISSSGSVPELKVENLLDSYVYLMDGQELVGAKQNRILNTDVLVPAKATIHIPVSCVEQGRWSYKSQLFSPGKTASHRTRSAKAERVRMSMKRTGRHDADQGAVWNEVAASLDHVCASSDTSALADAYRHKDKELRRFRDSLKMPEEAVGLAVFHGNDFRGLDLFDRHSTLVYFWESLVDSYALDWLGAQVQSPEAGTAAMDEVTSVMQEAASGTWEQFRAPGEGEDLRLDHPKYAGSALTWQGRTVIHLQLFPKGPMPQPEQDRQARERRLPRIQRTYGDLGGTIIC